MSTTRFCVIALFVAIPVILACCADSTSTHLNRTLVRAGLDDCYEVHLVHRSSKSREGSRPEERYEQVAVLVEPRDLPRENYDLKRADTATWPSSSHFQFERVEARSDPGRRRIWFVDLSDGRVVGSVDRDSGKTTGPDDPPPEWATPTGGERLN